jgi:hypothetical protein
VAVAALAVAAVALAGCTAGTKGGAKLGADDEPLPVLYLNVTVGNQTYRFSSDSLGGGNGSSPSGSLSASASGTSGSVQGNATSGNSTAQGNATAGNGTTSATGTFGNMSAGNGGSGGSGGLPGGVPGGPAPLDVRVEAGVSGLEADLPVTWTLSWGDAAGTQGGNASANATASPGAAPQQARETGSSLPARLQHTYTAAGRHEIAFALQAAGAAERTVSAGVVVQGSVPSGPAPGSFLGNQTQTFTGSALAAVPPVCGVLDTFEWKLNETFGGNRSVVQRVLVDATSEGTGDITLTLRDANGTEVASGGSIDTEGKFPPATYRIDVEACPAADLDYEVTAVGQHFAR